MDLSSDPLHGHMASSPPDTSSIELGELPNRAPSPTLPTRLPTAPTIAPFIVDLSSDPLGGSTPFSSDFSLDLAASGSFDFSRIPNRKRPCPPRDDHAPQPKEPRVLANQTPTLAREAILLARDLVVKAYSLTQAREEQAKLLDLLEVFREYIERGRIQAASSILATQVANLEVASQKIETKARALANTTPSTRPSTKPSTTYAAIAKAQSTTPPSATPPSAAPQE